MCGLLFGLGLARERSALAADDRGLEKTWITDTFYQTPFFGIRRL